MTRKHSLPVKAAIEQMAGMATTQNILDSLQVLASYYEDAKDTPQVRDKLVDDVSNFMQQIRDDLRRRKDSGMPDPVIQKHRPPMYSRHDLSGR